MLLYVSLDAGRLSCMFDVCKSYLVLLSYYNMSVYVSYVRV